MDDLQNSTVKEVIDTPNPKYQLVGFGGWLYIFAIGLAYQCYMSLKLIYDYYLLVGTADFQAVVDPSSESYNSLWKPFLALEFGANTIRLLLIILIGYLCFRMSKYFPKVSIFYISFSFVFILSEFFVMLTLNNYYESPIYMPEEIITPILQATIYAVLWIPYMLISKRVKNTFIM